MEEPAYTLLTDPELDSLEHILHLIALKLFAFVFVEKCEANYGNLLHYVRREVLHTQFFVSSTRAEHLLLHVRRGLIFVGVQ